MQVSVTKTNKRKEINSPIAQFVLLFLTSFKKLHDLEVMLIFHIYIYIYSINNINVCYGYICGS